MYVGGCEVARRLNFEQQEEEEKRESDREEEESKRGSYKYTHTHTHTPIEGQEGGEEEEKRETYTYTGTDTHTHTHAKKEEEGEEEDEEIASYYGADHTEEGFLSTVARSGSRGGCVCVSVCGNARSNGTTSRLSGRNSVGVRVRGCGGGGPRTPMTQEEGKEDEEEKVEFN